MMDAARPIKALVYWLAVVALALGACSAPGQQQPSSSLPSPTPLASQVGQACDYLSKVDAMSGWAASMQTALTAEDSSVIASLLTDLADLGAPPTDLAYLGSPTNQLHDRLVNLWVNMQTVQLSVLSGDYVNAMGSLRKVGASFELLKIEVARLSEKGYVCP